jgi:hypothetical protein
MGAQALAVSEIMRRVVVGWAHRFPSPAPGLGGQ